MKKYTDLIILKNEDGSAQKLWGLVKAFRDKRQQWQLDQDYVVKLLDQLQSPIPEKVKEARDALLFLNAYILAELDGNFKHLKDRGCEPSDTFKRGVYNARNASQRDFISNNQEARKELEDSSRAGETFTLGELVDTMKTVKKRLRKAGASVSELYKTKANKVTKF